MTADLARDLWRAARDAGSGLFPWELRVLKNFSAISLSVYIHVAGYIFRRKLMCSVSNLIVHDAIYKVTTTNADD